MLSVVEQVWSSYTTKDLLESAQHLACSPVEASQSHRDGGLASAQGAWQAGQVGMAEAVETAGEERSWI